MGLLSKMLFGIGKEIVKSSITNYSTTNSSTERTKNDSTSNKVNNLPRGRMKETNVVKGKDCKISSEPGIYYIKDKDTKSHKYIGQSNNVRQRIQQHTRDGRFNPETDIEAYSTNPNMGKPDLQRVEKEKIEKNKPTENIYAGGNGR